MIATRTSCTVAAAASCATARPQPQDFTELTPGQCGPHLSDNAAAAPKGQAPVLERGNGYLVHLADPRAKLGNHEVAENHDEEATEAHHLVEHLGSDRRVEHALEKSRYLGHLNMSIPFWYQRRANDSINRDICA